MCQLFFSFFYRHILCFHFFCQKKNNLFKKKEKLHTSTSLAKTMSSENQECFLGERKWKYERKSTRTAYKKEALPFQTMVKVLKIKADLWRIKKITLLNIKPYNLCKNSMWPTKAYIYLYIVHLKRIYNSYSQTKENKKAPNKTSCLILQCRRFE